MRFRGRMGHPTGDIRNVPCGTVAEMGTFGRLEACDVWIVPRGTLVYSDGIIR